MSDKHRFPGELNSVKIGSSLSQFVKLESLNSLMDEGPNMGLVGCGLRVKMKVQYRVTRLVYVLVGCRIKMFWWEYGLLILTDRMMVGCEMKNGTVIFYGCYLENNSHQEG